jgi:hypothetical protein
MLLDCARQSFFTQQKPFVGTIRDTIRILNGGNADARTTPGTSKDAVGYPFSPLDRRIRIHLFFESGRKIDERRGVVEPAAAYRADE